MKTSFVATVLNEQDSIDDFIRSILQQSKKVDEIIIVDGGSTDKTTAIIKGHKKVTLLSKKGNRSVGRNHGISKAKGDIILVSDVGCTLEKDWVKEISAPFRDNEDDVVSGYYKPVTTSVFEKCLAVYTCVMPDKVDPKNFLPSSRSVAFRKSAWEKVGGYPEHLETCEDLVFARDMKRAGLNFVFAKNAIVYWPQRKNVFEAFKQFYTYAKGDGLAHYFRKTTPFLFLRYLFAVALLFIAVRSDSIWWWIIVGYFFLAYIVWSIRKNYRYIKSREAIFYLPLLQFTADGAVFIGTTFGFILSILSFTKSFKSK